MLPKICKHCYVVEKVEDYYRSIGDEHQDWQSLKITAKCSKCDKEIIIYDWHNENLKRV